MATTAAEKLRIATHFILQSPTGEIDQVLRDVRVLLGSDASILGKSQMEAILTKYNQTQFVFAPSPDSPGQNVVCCPQALVDSKEGSVYLDPASKKHYKFDNINRTWSADSSKPKTLNSSLEQYRTLIQDAVQKYSSSTYLDPNKYATGVFCNDQGDITVILSAKNIALHNFWSGNWRSTFTLNVAKPNCTTQLAARIKINVHYFEDGNVQLNTDFSQTEPVKVGDPEATAAAVYAAMDSIESEFQNKLEEFYVDMHKYTFTGMRRFLPVTRNPMDWNPNAHKLAAQLKN